MKNILLILFLICAFFACKDDDGLGFDVPVEFRKDLSFRPVPGGAIMDYYLPRNSDIFGIRVRYTNAWGEPQIKDGSYLSDTILLNGFTESQTSVPARVSFFNNAMIESEPIEVTFDTERSATVAVFDSLSITPFWGGFSLGYTAPKEVTGMLHVFYVGVNPKTQKVDSILLSTMLIQSGGDTVSLSVQQAMNSVDVIVRTDDFSGKRVKQVVKEGLPFLSLDTLQPEEFNFRMAGSSSLENEEYGFGQKYLFDGDKKGIQYRRNVLDGRPYKYNTFMTREHADQNNARFIIDFGKPQIPASINIYAFLNYNTTWPFRAPYITFPDLLLQLWEGNYHSRLPAGIKLYGTNEDPATVELSACTLLYELEDEHTWADFQTSWCARTDTDHSMAYDENWKTATEAEVEAAEPVVLNMLCDYQGDDRKFRYVFFVIGSTYNGYYYGTGQGTPMNPQGFVTFNELEVCIKKTE